MGKLPKSISIVLVGASLALFGSIAAGGVSTASASTLTSGEGSLTDTQNLLEALESDATAIPVAIGQNLDQLATCQYTAIAPTTATSSYPTGESPRV